jgi:hypothetical protein
MNADGREAWLERNRDLRGRQADVWVRRGGLLLMTVLVLAALANVFGQASTTSSASGPAASLRLRAPERVRGGDLFQARFDVYANREIRQPELILDTGWLDGLTQNTTSPQPPVERSDNGRFVYQYDTIPAGRKLTVFFQYQVNPTHVGKTDQDVELWDGTTKLVHLDRSFITFP